MLQKVGREAAASTRPFWLIVLAAGMIVGIAMGLRQVMGLYLKPLTTELNIGREPFSLAMAIANLVWGLAAVPLGAIADRYGSGRVLVLGALSTMGGIYLMYAANSEFDLLLSGIFIGIGVGGTGITALVGAVGRAAPPEKRPQAIAALGMAAGIGSFLAFPYIHLFIETIGWKGSLLVTIATLALILPLALVLAGKPQAMSDVGKSQTLSEAFSEAMGHPSFWLLTFGFFVCGFHVAFYSVHLPAFVADKGMPGSVAIAALTAVGVANIAGTYLAGQSTKLFPKRYGLSFIYFMRCFAFLGLLFLPITPTTIIGISILLGLFWLSTVPLTSAMVATFFGPQWMSMLFGFVFLSHQIGSFVGLWLAGTLYDATKSYDMMWWISIGLALFAGLVHLPIREQPVARILGDAARRINVEITPFVIDLGSRVIQLANVTSVGLGPYHPLRPLGFALAAAAAAFAGFEVLSGGYKFVASGITMQPIWLAYLAGAIGLAMTLVARRHIVIRTASGDIATLPSPDRQSGEALVARIGEAMRLAGASFSSRPLVAAPTEDPPQAAATANLQSVAQHPHPAPSGDATQTTTSRRDAAMRDLDQIVRTIELADVPHKQALLDLLDVVAGHFRGIVSRSDAFAHWQSFADYADQYLGRVDGLQDQVARFDHIMRAR